MSVGANRKASQLAVLHMPQHHYQLPQHHHPLKRLGHSTKAPPIC
jgi:hypothetical protein